MPNSPGCWYPSLPSVCSPGPGTHWSGMEAVHLEPSLVSAALFQGSIWQAWCCGMSEPSFAGEMEGATQVSGSKDLQSSEEFSQAGCGQLEVIRPREGRGSGVLPRSFAGNKNLGGGQSSPIQPGKMKPCCQGSCWWWYQNTKQPGPWGSEVWGGQHLGL